ncbi:hypothetical protein ACFL51_00660 [Myxococcota bacterium]
MTKDPMDSVPELCAETDVLPEGLMVALLNHAAQPGACGPEYENEIRESVAEAMRPRSPIEAMLSIQLVEMHLLAVRAVAEAIDEADPRWGSVAIRATGAFRSLAKSWLQIQGKLSPNQIVRIERVDVRDGGQAVVAPMGTGGKGNADG